MNKKKRIIEYVIFPLLLLVYGLLLVNQGAALTDTGYNYANFLHFEGLDNMWKFSIYLASVCGVFFTHLPFGTTMLGLNIYTSLVKIAIAVITYFFVVKTLKLPAYLAALAELLALGFCWCPTALLYNYLTYLLFTLAGLLLIEAVHKKHDRYYVFAGICLGLNVMVRLPNVAEVALIAAVWLIAFFQKEKFIQVLKKTGLCIAGFTCGLVVPFIFISIKYGVSAYIQGIQELFKMSSEVAGYSVKQMILGDAQILLSHTRWLVVAAALVCVSTIAAIAVKKIKIVGTVASFLACVVMFAYFYKEKLLAFHYYNYDSIYILSHFLIILAGVCCLFYMFWGKEEYTLRMYAMVTGIILLVTPLGSNNYMFTVVSNLFIAIPFLFFCAYKLWKRCGESGFLDTKEIIPAKPLCIILTACIAMFFVQGVLFGANFVFRDGMDGEKRTSKITEIAALNGMYTTPDKASAYAELEKYLQDENLCGSDAIIYGNSPLSDHGIPSLAFYFDINPALSTSWPDLDSFSVNKFRDEIENIKIKSKADNKPLVIVQNDINTDREKEKILADFMEDLAYTEALKNDKFIVYR